MYTTIVSSDNNLNFVSYQYPCNRYQAYSGTYEKSFDTLAEALAAAKKTAMKTKEDVDVWTKTHVVKFPVADLEVVVLADTKA